MQFHRGAGDGSASTQNDSWSLTELGSVASSALSLSCYSFAEQQNSSASSTDSSGWTETLSGTNNAVYDQSDNYTGSASGNQGDNQSNSSSGALLEQGIYANSTLVLSLVSYSGSGNANGSSWESDGGSWSGQSYSGNDSDGTQSGNSGSYTLSALGSYSNGSYSLSCYVLQGGSSGSSSYNANEQDTLVYPGLNSTTVSQNYSRGDSTSSQQSNALYQSGVETAGNYANLSYNAVFGSVATASDSTSAAGFGGGSTWQLTQTQTQTLSGATATNASSLTFSNSSPGGSTSGSGSNALQTTLSLAVPGALVNLPPPDGSSLPVVGADAASETMGVSRPSLNVVGVLGEWLSATGSSAQQVTLCSNVTPAVPNNGGAAPAQAPAGGAAAAASSNNSSGGVQGFLMGMLDGYLDSSPTQVLGVNPTTAIHTGKDNLAADVYYLATPQGLSALGASFLREQLRTSQMNEESAARGAPQTPLGESPIVQGLSDGGNSLLQGVANVWQGFRDAPVNFVNGVSEFVTETYKETKDTFRAMVSASSYYTNEMGLTDLYVVDSFESKLWQGGDKAYNQGYNGETGSPAARQFAWDYKMNQLLGLVPYSGLVRDFNHAVETGDWAPYQRSSGDNGFWAMAGWATEGMFSPDEKGGAGGGGGAAEGGAAEGGGRPGGGGAPEPAPAPNPNVRPAAPGEGVPPAALEPALPAVPEPVPPAIRAPRRGPTPPDVIAEEMGPGHFLDHGDPSAWDYLGRKEVPATGRGFPPGTKKVYEVFLDENGQQVEWHYWVLPDGTTVGGKIVFPGSTPGRGLSR